VASEVMYQQLQCCVPQSICLHVTLDLTSKVSGVVLYTKQYLLMRKCGLLEILRTSHTHH